MTTRKKHSTTFEELKNRVLANPTALAAYRKSQKTWKLRAFLINARERAGFTQTDLAAQLDVSPSNISRIENNPDHANIKTIFKYLDACNADVDFVIPGNK